MTGCLSQPVWGRVKMRGGVDLEHGENAGRSTDRLVSMRRYRRNLWIYGSAYRQVGL